MRLALLLTLLPIAATAQNCGPVGAVLDHLAATYGETSQMTGMTGNETLLKILVNPETGSWTAVEIAPTGMACLRASGEHMQITPTPAAAMGEDG